MTYNGRVRIAWWGVHHLGLLVGLVLLLVGLLLGAEALVVLLASLTVALLVLGLALWIGDHYSVAARADRAAQAGRIGEALVLSTQCGPERPIAPLLVAALPGWPDAQHAVESAFREVAALQDLRGRARTLGVSGGVLDPLGRQAEVTAEVLGRLADRLGVAGAPPWASDGIRDGVERTLARIDQIAAALRAARSGLTELTVRGDEPLDRAHAEETARIRLLALAETARELASLAERRAGSPPKFRG